jgi:hypothetical protein
MKLYTGEVTYTTIQTYHTKDGVKHKRRIKGTKTIKMYDPAPGLSRIRVGGKPSKVGHPYVRPYKSFTQKKIEAMKGLV